jgi:hypothetical protein
MKADNRKWRHGRGLRQEYKKAQTGAIIVTSRLTGIIAHGAAAKHPCLATESFLPALFLKSNL